MAMLAQEMNVGRGLTGWVHDQAEKFARWRAYRDSVRQLSLRTEHELDDLGIARSDICDVARRSAYKVGA